MEFRVSDKVLKYETYVNDVLKEDLKKVERQRDKVMTEMAEFVQLKNSVETFKDANLLSDGIKTQMNIGCNFYVQANITNTERIYLDVGLGCYVEFTPEESFRFIEKRMHLLSAQLEKLQKSSAHIKAMIKMVLGGLHQLQNENNMST